MNIATEFNEFKDILFKKKIMRHKMRRIQRKKHRLGTYEINKISLSCFDGKRYVQDDSTNTFAYFHKDIYETFKRKIQSQVKAHSQVNTNSQTNKTNTN